jgi:hypothetical protein
VFPLTGIPSSQAHAADAADLRLGVLGALRQLACPAGGKLGDLLLHPPQALHLPCEAFGDLDILTGHQDTALADGVASHGDRGGDPLQGQVGDRRVAVGAEDEANGGAILVVRKMTTKRRVGWW